MKTILKIGGITMFSFLGSTFMVYALILALVLGLTAALISPFLVLNNQALIADGLSHIAFTGVVLGLILFDEPIYIALPIVVVAAILITYLGSLKMINHDASIGVVSAFSMAIGLIIVSLSTGFNRSIESLLVGNILTAGTFDLISAIILFIIVVVIIILFYRPLLSITYDPSYAKVKGVKHNLLKYLLSIITASFITIGIKTAGMLLISAFIIFPALIASQLSKSFKQTVIFGLVVSLIAVFVGITTSYHLDIPVGSAIVVLYTVLLFVSIIIRRFKKVS